MTWLSAPASLWNDGRTQRQVDYLNGVIGKDKLSRYTANIAFRASPHPNCFGCGRTAGQLRPHQKIMLPKDYINLS